MQTIMLSLDQRAAIIENMPDEDRRMLALTPADQINMSDGRVRFTRASIAAIHQALRHRGYHCYSCGETKPITAWDRDSNGCELCTDCYDEAGAENTHSDNGHGVNGIPAEPSCSVCQAIAAAEYGRLAQGA